MDCLDRHPSSPRRGRSMARGLLSLLRSGTCTQKGKWCRVLGESSSDRGPVVGLRREPDRGGETQKPNGAGTPRTRPDETKDRQARQQAKGGREARRRDERTSTRAGRQARTQAGKRRQRGERRGGRQAGGAGKRAGGANGRASRQASKRASKQASRRAGEQASRRARRQASTREGAKQAHIMQHATHDTQA